MRIFLAGHNGMVGSSIHRLLSNEKYKSCGYRIITAEKEYLNLLNSQEVETFFNNHDIDAVIVAAAKVGGINANNIYPAEFIYQNLTIQNNIIHSSYKSNIQKLLFLGSSCIYPKFSDQPIKENSLLTGKLEETNEPYAIAKIAGLKMCESYNRQYGLDYRSIMPTNLYGPGDNFHYDNSHVLPALLRRFHDAKINEQKNVTIWGSGEVYREFLHVDDLASASIFILNLDKEKYLSKTSEMQSHINIGSGNEIKIKELALLIKGIVGFKGEVSFDRSKPDGTPRKLIDSSIVNELGWVSNINLKEGIKMTYDWFLENKIRST